MNQIVRCIGITGLNGAGKTSLANFLNGHFAVDYYEVREFLEKERQERCMPKGRESLIMIANLLRKKYGPDYIMRSLAEGAIVNPSHNPFIIESIRCVGEIDYLSNTFGKAFVLIGVDAQIKTRYERVLKRGSQTDRVDFDEFLRQEKLEAEQEDPWKQNLFVCMSRVSEHCCFRNDGDEKTFYSQIQFLAANLGLMAII